jgi:RNA polymerase sigma-70 factor (ECF subfamily)
MNPSLAAFAPFMREHQDKVFATALRLTRNRAQAEDIAQEVFIRAHDHFAQLQHHPGASGWLRTVATNLALNHLTRYRNRWRFFSELRRDDDSNDGAPEVEFAAPESFFTAIDAADRQALVARALDALPEHQRVPLVLFHFEAMPYDEIARRLGVSLAKVKTDIMRGRSALARRLVGEAELRPAAQSVTP